MVAGADVLEPHRSRNSKSCPISAATAVRQLPNAYLGDEVDDGMLQSKEYAGIPRKPGV